MIWETPEVYGNIPSKRSSHRMVVVNNKIYLFGGGSIVKLIHIYNNIFSMDTYTSLRMDS